MDLSKDLSKELSSPITQEERELLKSVDAATPTNLDLCLLRKWRQSEASSQLLIAKINQLESQIQALKEANEKHTAGYETDEAEFDPQAGHEKQPPGWILNMGRRNKKRKAESTPEISPEKPANKNGNNPPKPIPPPPIFIANVKHTQPVIAKLKLTTANLTTLSTEGNFKINCYTADEYRLITGWLNHEGYEWHSFSDKNSRPLRVMARGLYAKTSSEDILLDLKAKGLEATSAVNILCNKTKKPLNLFMLTFTEKQDPKTVFAIKVIEHQKVHIEEIRRPTNRIAQCKNCQDYNHVRTFCHRRPKCVKCAGDHKSSECKLDKNSKPKCTNCKEEHTANYRGCPYARGLQAARIKARKEKQTPQTARFSLSNHPEAKQPARANVSAQTSYASKLKGDAPKPPQTAVYDPVLILLQRMEQRLSQQEKFNQIIHYELQTIKKELKK